MTKKATVSQLREHDKYDRLLAATRGLQPLSTAVAHPCDESSLRGALDAARANLIVPILVGPKAKIKAVAEKFALDISGHEIVDAPHSQAAAEMAVELVRKGTAELLMKGSLHSDELLGAVAKRDTGLRTGRRISHVFVMDVPDARGDAVHNRRCGEHLPRPDGEARHRSERHRSICGARPRHAEGCYPIRRRDGKP